MNQPNTPPANHYTARDASRKLKFGIIAVILALVVMGGSSMVLISVLDDLNARIQNQETETLKGSSIIWVERTDDYDVFEDTDYLKKDRQIYLYDEMKSEQIVLEEKDLHKYGKAVPVLYNMIQYIIRGDADAYNKLFSAKYYKDHEPEAPFRMQPLYGVVITIPESSEALGEDTYILQVSYRICGNDGTFRTDIGHEEARTQTFILSTNSDNVVLIDDIR